MRPMVTDKTRRSLLKAALLGMASPILPFGCQSHSITLANRPALMGCCVLGKGTYGVVIANEFGQAINTLPIPARGHGVASNTAGYGVVFARRPGDFFIVFDYHNGRIISKHAAKPGRYFYGHGAFSNDGRWLFATEGEIGTSRGIIGVYDSQSQYQKVDELSGFGLGPHEVVVLPDDTLAIGVGGIHTEGRTQLNRDTMQPSLSYLSSQGELLEQASLSDHQLSIRHLAFSDQGEVFCAQQFRGDRERTLALVSVHQRGGEFIDLQAEPEEWERFDHYIGSIASDKDWILATSPRGNCFGIWSRETKELVDLRVLPDASGVASVEGAFRVSSGSGKVVEHDVGVKSSKVHSSIQWDNHWSRIAR